MRGILYFPRLAYCSLWLTVSRVSRGPKPPKLAPSGGHWLGRGFWDGPAQIPAKCSFPWGGGDIRGSLFPCCKILGKVKWGPLAQICHLKSPDWPGGQHGGPEQVSPNPMAGFPGKKFREKIRSERSKPRGGGGLGGTQGPKDPPPPADENFGGRLAKKNFFFLAQFCIPGHFFGGPRLEKRYLRKILKGAQGGG